MASTKLLLKRFVDVVRVCYIHIISRNHSNMLLTCIKQKLVQLKHSKQRKQLKVISTICGKQW